MNGFNILSLLLSVVSIESSRSKRGSSSITLGPPIVIKDPGNHTVSIGQNFQFYCKIRANPLAHVALKRNRVDKPISVRFPRYGTSPTGGNTIVLLDLMNLDLDDEGRYTCFAENEYGTIESHGWLKFVKECNCNQFGVAFPQKPCDDDGNCVCRENVGGDKCDRCQEGFFNFPFCQPCECNPWGTVGQSESCDENTGECNCLPDRATFDPIKCDGCPPSQFYNAITNKCQPCRCYPDGSATDECDYMTGQCQCQENFTGTKCSSCKDGFYNRGEGCIPCECVVENTYGFDAGCDAVDGQCYCKRGLEYTDPRTCASCPGDTFYNENTRECQDCGCNPLGTDRCTNKGECVCKENFTGIKCDECEPNHYGFEFGFCEPCGCNPHGTIGGTLQCDAQGNCPCKQGQNRFNWKQCDGCPNGQALSFSNPLECEDCDCHPKGALNNECDLYTAQCECAPNTYGRRCDQCEPGSYGLSSFGKCMPCNCDPYNSLSLECDTDSGQCACRQGILFTDSRTCAGCPLGEWSKVPGTCEPCNCNTNGSISVQCDFSGQCACQPTVQSLKCDECKPGYFNFKMGGCDPCNCNPYGVVDPKDQVCDPNTGQCNCKEGQNRISSRTCDGCPDGFYVNVNNPLQCFSCDCHPYGAVNPNCDLYSGTCDCGPNVTGDKCDECEEGFYGLNIVGIGKCVPCECDPEGSENPVCDMFGQCQCKAGYGTVNPRTCEGCPNGMYYKDGFCIPCGCDPRGSLSNLCREDGSCFCASYVQSDKCDTCQMGYYFGNPNQLGCIPCGCDQMGTISASGECDTNTGQCNCIEEALYFFLDPRRCEPCALYQYSFNNQCTDCDCNQHGSTGLQCDFMTGQCPCVDGAYGIKCDQCEDGYFDLMNGCLPCNCNTEYTIGGDVTCDISGQCNCKPGYTYTDSKSCTTCGDGTYQNNGVCSPCDCHLGGSVNGSCDGVTGQCYCLDNVIGRRCDQCEGNYYGINSSEGCTKPCGCNVNGTIGRSEICDQTSGQCSCLPGRTQYQPRTCDGCLNNFFTNEYIDPVTRECIPCNCLDTGSRQYNCSTYEGVCDCNPGIIGDKCDTIPESRGDVVEKGKKAVLTCNLFNGTADKTVWIGEDCISSDCGNIVVETREFMSLSYYADEDASFTCRFQFGDVTIDKLASVDVFSYHLSSVTVQKGSAVTLTAVVSGLAERPNRGIDWKKSGILCNMKKCKLGGHNVQDTITKDPEKGYILTSEITLGPVKETVRYSAIFKYQGKTFRTFSVVSIYECNCNPVGSKSLFCDPETLQCDCRSRYEGLKCDQCKDEFYNPEGGCLPCDCDPDTALSSVCHKKSGQCVCPRAPFIDTRRCEKCEPGKYLKDGACVPCGCVVENTHDNSMVCADDGQCPCVAGFPYVDTRICERCQSGLYFKDGECVACDCYPEGSVSSVCDEVTGRCTCKENYNSEKCGTCKKEYHGPSEGCEACNCDPENSLRNTCHGITGQCQCIQGNGPFVDPVRCGACGNNTVLEDGACIKCDPGTFVENNVCTYCDSGSYFFKGACVECKCDPKGGINNVCDSVTGRCTCNERFEGHLCQDCQDGYYSSKDGCPECDCDPENSLSLVCSKMSGQCQCDPALGPFVDTRTCETCLGHHIVVEGQCVECPLGTFVRQNTCTYCKDGTYLSDDGICVDCGCLPVGSEDSVCDRVTGICTCIPGFTGDKCQECQSGYYKVAGLCVECDCVTQHTVNSDPVCNDNGQCKCDGSRPYIDTRRCEPCADGLVIVQGSCKKCSDGYHIQNYQCTECMCSWDGTKRCDPVSGQCICKSGFTGDQCDECQDGFYSDKCVACLCSPNSLNGVCDKSHGQCTCSPHFMGRACNQCQDGYYGETCEDCGCEQPHALSPVCDKQFGQCECPRGLYFKDSRTCELCPYHHKVQNGRCVKCEPGTELVNNVCVPCQEGYFEALGTCILCKCNSKGTATCNRVTGDCTCTSRFEGQICDTCVVGRYDPSDGCKECKCDPENSASNECDRASGQCDCVSDLYLLNPRTCKECPAQHVLTDDGLCETCAAGYFVEDNACRLCDEGYYLRFGICEECRCNPVGSLSTVCNPITGICDCGPKHQGEKCQNCQVGYFNSDLSRPYECTDCGCVIQNTLGGSAQNPEKGMKECDWMGQCYCRAGLAFVNSRTCKSCPDGQIAVGGICQSCKLGTFFLEGACTPCLCYTEGSVGYCDVDTGACSCKKGYQGLTCEDCADGYYKSGGSCVPCECDPDGSLSTACNKATGQCPCRTTGAYDVPRTCFKCADKTFFSGGICEQCRCFVGGSVSASCDSDGNCTCLENVEGKKCNKCTAYHYGIDSGKGCSPCGCNEFGVMELNTVLGTRRELDMKCDEVTGQCNCKSGQTRYQSRTCDGCPYKQYLGGPDTCVPCKCHPEGSRSYECDLYSGECYCNPQIIGKRCDTRGCEWGLWEYGPCSKNCGSDGTRERKRKQYPSQGGDFTTIVKVAECTATESQTIRCRQRRPCSKEK